MSLVEELNGYVDFCYDYMVEMRDTKSSEYKAGTADGIEQAMSWLRDYLVEYPDFVDPKHRYDKFKMQRRLLSWQTLK